MKASVKDMVKEIMHLFFPLLRLNRANKIVDEKITQLENGVNTFSYMLGYENLDAELAEKYLTKTFEARKSLEDKAKANVFGVTIAVSLIVGFSQIFTNTNFHASGLAFRIIAILLVLYSLVSVTVGTILSLLVLGKYNRIYDVFPEDANSSDEKQKVLNIAINAELNSLYNVKRNNILYSSYGLIINFLVTISFSFMAVIVNTQQQDIRQEMFKIQTANLQNEINLQRLYNELVSNKGENKDLIGRLVKLEKDFALGKSRQIKAVGR